MSLIQILAVIIGAGLLVALFRSGKAVPANAHEEIMHATKAKLERERDEEEQAEAKVPALEDQLFEKYFAPRGVPADQRDAILELFRAQAQPVDNRHYVRIIESQMKMADKEKR